MALKSLDHLGIVLTLLFGHLGRFNFTLAASARNEDGNFTMTDSGCHQTMLYEVAWSIAPRVHEVIGALWKYPLDCTSFSSFSTLFFQQCPQQELEPTAPVSGNETTANLSCHLCNALLAELPEHWRDEDPWWTSVPLPDLKSNGTQPHPHPFCTLTAKKPLEPSVEMKLERKPVSCRMGEQAALWTVYTNAPIESVLPLVIAQQNSSAEVLEITVASDASGAQNKNEQGPPLLTEIIGWGKDTYTAVADTVSATWTWLFSLGISAVDALVSWVTVFLRFAFVLANLCLWVFIAMKFIIVAFKEEDQIRAHLSKMNIWQLQVDIMKWVLQDLQVVRGGEIDQLRRQLSEKRRALQQWKNDVNYLQNRLEQKEEQNASLLKVIDSKLLVDEETWQFQADSGEWVSFPDRASKVLMAKFQEGYEACEITIDRKIYEVNFQKKSQTNQRTRKERNIRCFFGLPPHWKISDEEALAKFKPGAAMFDQTMHRLTDGSSLSALGRLLNESLLRQDGTSCTCLHGNSNFIVFEAWQIKNLSLWRRYQRFVRSICDKQKQHGICPEECPPVSKALTESAEDLGVDLAGNERLLLHGTRDFDVGNMIAMEGFDNRTARESGLYGKGTYFAAQTCKSAQYAKMGGLRIKASPQEPGTMLLARVAIGDPFFTPGPCHTESRPPEKNGIRADSIIAKVGIPNGQSNGTGIQSHMEVVTFAPEQAYPEYLIRFIEE